MSPVSAAVLPLIFFGTKHLIRLTVATSKVGFAFFGSMLAKIGDFKVGNGFAQLARSLVDKLSAKDCSCEVYMVTTELDCL